MSDVFGMDIVGSLNRWDILYSTWRTALYGIQVPVTLMSRSRRVGPVAASNELAGFHINASSTTIVAQNSRFVLAGD